MPSGKQILLALLTKFSQRLQEPAALDRVSDMIRGGLLLHGSTADESWFKIIRVAWLSEESRNGQVRQGLGLGKQGIFLSDLFEEMTADGKIPGPVHRAYPALTKGEYESATYLMWLILSSCQFFSELASVENGGKLDKAAMSELVDSYVSKLNLFKDDPYGYLGLERPNSEPSAAPNRRQVRRRTTRGVRKGGGR